MPGRNKDYCEGLRAGPRRPWLVYSRLNWSCVKVDQFYKLCRLEVTLNDARIESSSDIQFHPCQVCLSWVAQEAVPTWLRSSQRLLWHRHHNTRWTRKTWLNLKHSPAPRRDGENGRGNVTTMSPGLHTSFHRNMGSYNMKNLVDCEPTMHMMEDLST